MLFGAHQTAIIVHPVIRSDTHTHTLAIVMIALEFECNKIYINLVSIMEIGLGLILSELHTRQTFQKAKK